MSVAAKHPLVVFSGVYKDAVKCLREKQGVFRQVKQEAEDAKKRVERAQEEMDLAEKDVERARRDLLTLAVMDEAEAAAAIEKMRAAVAP